MDKEKKNITNDEEIKATSQITKKASIKNVATEKVTNKKIAKENTEAEKKAETKTKKGNKHIRRNIVILTSVIAIIVGYIYARGNYLEIKEIGENYLSIYRTDMIYTIITFVINFVVLYFTFYLTNKTLRKGLKVFFDDEKKEMPKFPNKSVSFIIALIGSAVSTKMLLNKILLCISGSQFGITDKVFHLDISFFVFIKPLIQYVLIYLLVLVIASLIYALLYAIIVLNRSFEGVDRESIAKCDLVGKVGSRVKLIGVLLGLIVFVSMGLNIGNEKFMNIELKDGTTYALYGAGKADITIKIAGYAILALLTTFSIFKAYKAVKEKSVRRFLGNVMIVPIYLIVFAVVLALYQSIFIGSNTLEKNQDYIKENIDKTKQAYGIASDAVRENSIEYSGTITKSEIDNNKDLLSNIAIVTKENVLQDLSASQTSKGYYTYRQSQIASYNIEGKDRLVYVTPREISSRDVTYSNKTYQYTHGYGTIVTMAGATDEYGNLINLQKDIGEKNKEVIKSKEPRIYFGVENNSAVVINTKKTELDYPTTDNIKDVEYSYEGNSGLKLNFIDRIILGIRENDMKLAFSGSVTSDSKIITNRNIVKRAKTIMPYLEYDENPYMVIDKEGNQVWVLDAYTVSKEYPYAQKIEIGDTREINYIRNSVKVLINAYDGAIKFYITDRTDPIVMAYNKIYPDVFENEDDIPEDVSEHFVYPQYLYNIQTKIIEKYHNAIPETMYRANDIWSVAESDLNGKSDKMNSYYTMVKNELGRQELGLIVPFTMYGKQNIISYMVGTTENGVNKLNIYKFQADSNVLSPMQLEAQINQDENIASELASLNVSGTKITKNLIAVPINNTILYVETYYGQYINETNQKPVLKRVVVASGNKVAIGNNIQEAIENLMSKATNIDTSNNESLEDLISLIIKANENVKNSGKNGDWKLFGEDMQELTNLVDGLKELMQENLKNDENDVAEENTVKEQNQIEY